jgi:hypothetical protein
MAASPGSMPEIKNPLWRHSGFFCAFRQFVALPGQANEGYLPAIDVSIDDSDACSEMPVIARRRSRRGNPEPPVIASRRDRRGNPDKKPLDCFTSFAMTARVS